jgi:cyclophilin family peptidyl-prolyl cis-trans isomerase
MAAPTAIRLSQAAINESELPGGFVAILATVDADAADTFTYALVDGEGDEHNAWFEIQGNLLVNTQVVDREALASLRLRLRSTDKGGQSVEQAVELAVNNLQDPVLLAAPEVISFTRTSDSFSVSLSDWFSDPFSSGRIARFYLDPLLAATIHEVYWDAYPQLRERSWLDVVLFDQEQEGAPLTVANLERYVDAGLYSDTFLHRLVPNFVLQGGGFVWPGDEQATSSNPEAVPTFAAVRNEFSEQRSNIRGTVAMAKLGGDPNSATSQWFFNLADNSANLDNQNGGFTVFGRLRDNTDLLLLDALGSLQTLNAGGVFSDLPLYKLGAGIDPTDVLRFADVEILDEPPLQFVVVDDSLSRTAQRELDLQLDASGQLTISPAATAMGETTSLTIIATNLLGETVQRRMDVITDWSTDPKTDRFEDNDTFQSATDLGAFADISQQGDLSIHSGSDVDYFSFLLDADAPSDSVVSLWSDDAVDLVLSLYNSNGSLISASDHEGAGESIVLRDLAAGSYYIGVASSGGSTGWYDLGFDRDPGGLAVEDLIDSPGSIYIQKAYSELGVVPVFIDVQGISESFGDEQADAMPMSGGAVDFIVSALKRLESEINISFAISTSEYVDQAIRFMKHEDDSAYSGSGHGGYAAYRYTFTGPAEAPLSVGMVYNDISVNTLYGDDDSDFWRHAAIHELGHALGLEHPFDFDDGDGYGSETDPTVDQTVMAYGDSIAGSYPLWFQDLDLQALTQIWGQKPIGDSLDRQPIDLTGDGTVDRDDVRLVLRHMFGSFPGESLVEGIPVKGDVSEIRDQIINYGDTSHALGAGDHWLDVNGDGLLNPLNDGLALAGYVASQGHALSADQYSSLFGGAMQALDDVHERLAQLTGF